MSSKTDDSARLKRVFTSAGAEYTPKGMDMAAPDSAMAIAQAELAARVALVGMRASVATTAALAAEVDAIRAAALDYGLYPAVAVTHAIDAALARGERGALVLGWIEVLRDAVSSDRQDRGACESYVAACSVRLAG